jgi:hypothetical protein
LQPASGGLVLEAPAVFYASTLVVVLSTIMMASAAPASLRALIGHCASATALQLVLPPSKVTRSLSSPHLQRMPAKWKPEEDLESQSRRCSLVRSILRGSRPPCHGSCILWPQEPPGPCHPGGPTPQRASRSLVEWDTASKCECSEARFT